MPTFAAVSWWPLLSSSVIPLARIKKAKLRSSPKPTKHFSLSDLKPGVWTKAVNKSTIKWARIICCGTEEVANEALNNVTHRDSPPPPELSPGSSVAPSVTNFSFNTGSAAGSSDGENGSKENSPLHIFSEDHLNLARNMRKAMLVADGLASDSNQSNPGPSGIPQHNPHQSDYSRQTSPLDAHYQSDGSNQLKLTLYEQTVLDNLQHIINRIEVLEKLVSNQNSQNVEPTSDSLIICDASSDDFDGPLLVNSTTPQPQDVPPTSTPEASTSQYNPNPIHEDTSPYNGPSQSVIATSSAIAGPSLAHQEEIGRHLEPVASSSPQYRLIPNQETSNPFNGGPSQSVAGTSRANVAPDLAQRAKVRCLEQYVASKGKRLAPGPHSLPQPPTKAKRFYGLPLNPHDVNRQQESFAPLLSGSVINEIFTQSTSRPNFATKLARSLYRYEERVNRNCNGKCGKGRLCQRKLAYIRHVVFLKIPVGPHEFAPKIWGKCSRAIDTDTRQNYQPRA